MRSEFISRNQNSILTALLAVLSAFTAYSQPVYKLWYEQPAHRWTEALPIGNGRLGAMIFGAPGIDRIQLNEETIWAGQPNSNSNPAALKVIPQIRQLIFDGKYTEAEILANEKVLLAKNSGMPYQTFGDLELSFPDQNNYSDYYRELNLDSAKAMTSYTANGIHYRRDYFSSLKDQVIIIHLSADKPGSVDLNIRLSSPHKDPAIKSEGDQIFLSGVSDSHEGVKGKVQFMGRVAVETKAGSSMCRDGVISVNNADEATIYVSIATNFVNFKDITADQIEKSKSILTDAVKIPYKDALKRHLDVYQPYFNRSSLNLGTKGLELPTDKLIEGFSKTHNNYLVALYYQFGRYLLISSSMPGTQPPTLQGIWNDKRFPSWDSKYTTNINLEMNYWPAESANLSELQEPLFKLLNEISETGTQTAREMYNLDGWVLHHNTDIWRITGPVDHAPSGMWPTGAAWLCQNIWSHYLYTGDKEFLARYYPVLRGAALFLSQLAVHDPDKNWLVITPSNSPENTHLGSKNKATAAAGTSLDNELVHDLWSELISAAQILDIKNDSLVLVLKKQLTELPPLQIGRFGQLQEWMYDWDNPNDTHRHVSHLYGVYPSNIISPYRTPELCNAARTSLIHRGDPSTGWSMAWKVCLWARFLDGDHAYKLLTDQLDLVRDEKKKGGTYPNLFDAHPPFQIDGNFGCIAGIAEMLLQSQDGFVNLLPALPSELKEGSVRGLVARGGFILDMDWKNGKLTKAVIHSTLGGNCRLAYSGKLTGLKKARAKNSNPLYQIESGMKELFNGPRADFDVPVLNLYDLGTEAGRTYQILSK